MLEGGEAGEPVADAGDVRAALRQAAPAQAGGYEVEQRPVVDLDAALQPGVGEQPAQQQLRRQHPALPLQAADQPADLDVADPVGGEPQQQGPPAHARLLQGEPEAGLPQQQRAVLTEPQFRVTAQPVRLLDRRTADGAAHDDRRPTGSTTVVIPTSFPCPGRAGSAG